MPTVRQSDNSNNSLTVAGLDSDEFVPKVSLHVSKVDESGGETKCTLDKKEDIPLSEYLDNGYRNNQTVVIETSKSEITLPFEIIKGNRESDDDKGIITVTLFKKLEDGTTTSEIKGVKITNEKEFETTYRGTHSVKLEFKDLKESTDFYIDFYAKDDYEEGWWWWEDDVTSGKLTNIHCGRVKIEFVVPGPKVFSEKEVNKYRKYIISNASLPPDPNTQTGYGYGETDKHDCVTAINRSLRKLLSDNSISAKANMDDQMRKLISIDYATEQIEIEFKDSKGKKTKGDTDPSDFFNKNLAEKLKENLTEVTGYYFFGMSVMDGFHSVMIVVNKKSDSNIKYQIFDQHGTVLVNTYAEQISRVNSWYDENTINNWLIDYVNLGNTTQSGGIGRTTTTITQIKHRDEK